MLEMIKFVFPISAFMVSSSRWGLDSASGDDGRLEKPWDGPYVLWYNSGWFNDTANKCVERWKTLV